MAVATDAELVDLLDDLIQLDFDAIDAYEVAIDRLETVRFQEQLRSFLDDHREHTESLAALVQDLGAAPKRRGDMVRVLTQGRVVIGSISGDEGVLKAMRSNEEATTARYEQALEITGLPPEVRRVLERNLSDERRHRAWIAEAVKSL